MLDWDGKEGLYAETRLSPEDKTKHVKHGQYCSKLNSRIAEFERKTRNYIETYRKVRAEMKAERAFSSIYEKISSLGMQ